jgi:hypothetical protein
VAGDTPGAAFAATWRNSQGAIVGTTYGGTMCLWPRKPWRIRITREGFEHVIRCGECPGCLEFERRRLASRLHARYAPSSARGADSSTQTGTIGVEGAAKNSRRLFLVRIFAPLELHASIAHALHRRRGVELEPGMWRLGATSFALLARTAPSLRAVLKRMGLRHRVEPLRLSRGRRAFRNLTAGLLVAREIYGEQRNRWYARGLPKADRLKWEVKKICKYASYDRWRSPRANIESRVVLVPPDVWRLSRPDRRSLRGMLLRAPDPEGVARVMGLVADTLRNAGRRLPVSAAPKALLTREQVSGWYKQMAERREARTALPGSDSSLTPSSEEGGYVSSEHKQGELMPLELARAREKEVRDARKRRALKESLEIIERMRRKSKGEE